MKNFTQTLLTELDSQLQFIQMETENPIKQAELSIKVILATMAKLKKFILRYKFSNEEEEIYFFKNIKPKFSSKLIYFNRIYNIETKKPYGGKKCCANITTMSWTKSKDILTTILIFIDIIALAALTLTTNTLYG